VTEASPAGSDWLASLVVRWERAQACAEAFGARVVHARFGLVLACHGGALEQLARPFRFHAGGFVGDGSQIVSWVHIADAVQLLTIAIDDARVRGPINVTSPAPARMADLASAIGHVLGRKSYLRVPGALLSAALGQGADPILTGQRVLPGVASELGYEFAYPELLTALENLLGRG
jgi:uncharacterized protein (TIGR01777 family)